MAQTVHVTCDACGVVLRDDDDRDRSVDFQMGADHVRALGTSIDPTPSEGTYRFRSMSWDLCVPCATKVRDAIVAIAGTGGHDSLSEVLS